MPRHHALVLLLAGCTVGPTPVPPYDAGCELELPPSVALGPYPDRVRCVAPSLRLAQDPSPAQQAFTDELDAIALRWCEQERARISFLPHDLWELERDHGHAGRFPVELSRWYLELGALPRELLDGCDDEARALSWLERHRALLALDEGGELELVGTSHRGVKLRPRWHGLPIGSETGLASIRLVPGGFFEARYFTPAWRLPPSHVPAVSAEQAARLAGSGQSGQDGVLMVWHDVRAWDRDEGTHLAWVFRGCVVDALDGAPLRCD